MARDAHRPVISSPKTPRQTPSPPSPAETGPTTSERPIQPQSNPPGCAGRRLTKRLTRTQAEWKTRPQPSGRHRDSGPGEAAGNAAQARIGICKRLKVGPRALPGKMYSLPLQNKTEEVLTTQPEKATYAPAKVPTPRPSFSSKRHDGNSGWFKTTDA